MEDDNEDDLKNKEDLHIGGTGVNILHNSPIIIGEKFPYFQDLGKSLPIFSDVVKFPSLRWGRKLVLGKILKA